MAYAHTEDRDPHYPKMLFRTGTEHSWEGWNFDTMTVADEDEELAAIDDGWRDHPNALDHDGDNKSGGSKPRKAAPAKEADTSEDDPRPALREEYREKFGKAPFAGWSADQLREKLAAEPEQEAA